jgi:aspartate ammonia-lyase
LNKLTPHNFKNAPDLIESMESQRQIQKFAAALKSTAIEMSRIASDLRLLASGPNTGFYEIELPAVQPGSSIMPGKVNPSILECVNMVCYRVMGAESAVSYATLGGQLDLNVNMPLMSAELIHSTQILGNAAEMMADQCVSGISANVEKCRDFALKSASLATALNPILGYAKVAEIVKEFVKTGKSFPDIIKEKGLLTDMQIKKVLAPENMTRPGIAKL